MPASGTATMAPRAANARAAVMAACSSGQEPLPCKSTMVGSVAGAVPPGRINRYRRTAPSMRISNDSEMTQSVDIASLPDAELELPGVDGVLDFLGVRDLVGRIADEQRDCTDHHGHGGHPQQAVGVALVERVEVSRVHLLDRA